MGVDPRISGGYRIGGNPPAFLQHGIVPVDLRANESGHLVKLHIGHPEPRLPPGPADGLFHFRDGRERGRPRLEDSGIAPGGDNIVGRDIDVDLQQRLVVPLKCGKQLAQRVDVLLDLHAPGIYAGGAPLAPQLSQGAVDAPNGFLPVHGPRLDHNLGSGQGENAGQPCVSHQRGVIHHPEVVGDDVVDLHGPGLDVHHLRLSPLGIVLRTDLFDLMLVKVQTV